MPAEQNPYRIQLAGQNPELVLGQTVAEVKAVVAQLGPEGLRRGYAPGKWSAGEIVCHLADCEIAFAFRLRQALSEPHHVIQPFDQEAWAKSYPNMDPATALGVFAALRGWNLALLRTLTPEAYECPVTHPERGSMNFKTLIETIAGHDLNHLKQLKSITGIEVA